mmetsp:Transcript_22191/g.59857  ORF Transcript_22191/g.59857 Transcript_22191/m.59857 type:complete len:243 (-) Transcript_22191:664-1392(-)
MAWSSSVLALVASSSLSWALRSQTHTASHSRAAGSRPRSTRHSPRCSAPSPPAISPSVCLHRSSSSPHPWRSWLPAPRRRRAPRATIAPLARQCATPPSGFSGLSSSSQPRRASTWPLSTRHLLSTPRRLLMTASSPSQGGWRPFAMASAVWAGLLCLISLASSPPSSPWRSRRWRRACSTTRMLCRPRARSSSSSPAHSSRAWAVTLPCSPRPAPTPSGPRTARPSIRCCSRRSASRPLRP